MLGEKQMHILRELKGMKGPDDGAPASSKQRSNSQDDSSPSSAEAEAETRSSPETIAPEQYGQFGTGPSVPYIPDYSMDFSKHFVLTPMSGFEKNMPVTSDVEPIVPAQFISPHGTQSGPALGFYPAIQTSHYGISDFHGTVPPPLDSLDTMSSGSAVEQFATPMMGYEPVVGDQMFGSSRSGEQSSMVIRSASPQPHQLFPHGFGTVTAPPSSYLYGSSEASSGGGIQRTPKPEEEDMVLESFRRLFQLENTPENNTLARTAVKNKFDMKGILLAGLRALTYHGPVSSRSFPFLANPYKNSFGLVLYDTVDAFLANARALDFDIAELYKEVMPSPFHHPHVKGAGDVEAIMAATSPDYPDQLRPVASQIIYSHRPYLDLLPFPTFRARAIALASLDPPMFDEWELKQDIVNDGLYCWRSSTVTTGQQPWDMRSWEAAPWFLNKWSFLVGGEEGELWKQTKWWRQSRGEHGAI